MEERRLQKTEKDEGWTKILLEEEKQRRKLPPRLAGGTLRKGGDNMELLQKRGESPIGLGCNKKSVPVKIMERKSFLEQPTDGSEVTSKAGSELTRKAGSKVTSKAGTEITRRAGDLFG